MLANSADILHVLVRLPEANRGFSNSQSFFFTLQAELDEFLILSSEIIHEFWIVNFLSTTWTIHSSSPRISDGVGHHRVTSSPNGWFSLFLCKSYTAGINVHLPFRFIRQYSLMYTRLCITGILRFSRFQMLESRDGLSDREDGIYRQEGDIRYDCSSNV